MNEHDKNCKCKGTGFVGIYDRLNQLSVVHCDGKTEIENFKLLSVAINKDNTLGIGGFKI
jgi:hypothetical protein